MCRKQAALNSTGPQWLQVRAELWHSLFCLVLFWGDFHAFPPTPRPLPHSQPFTSLPHPPPLPSPSFPPLLCVCLPDEFCLFVWIQSDTASPPAYRHTRQTDRLAGDNITVAETGRGGEQCGGWGVEETDVQTDRAPTTGGWESLARQSGAPCRRSSEISAESCFRGFFTWKFVQFFFPKSSTFRSNVGKKLI